MTGAVIGTDAVPDDSQGESRLDARGMDLRSDNRTPHGMTDPTPMDVAGGTVASTPGALPARFRLLSRFGRAQDGATAVEFAFISIPFFMLLAAILETAMLFWTSQVLEEAVSQASRRLLTGESHQRYPASDPEAFKRDVCAGASAMVDCDKLIVDVRTYTSFANAKTGVDGSNPISAGGLNTTGFGYNQPLPGQIVVVRAVLPYTLTFTYWSASLANIGSGRRGIVASVAFRTEPYNAPAT